MYPKKNYNPHKIIYLLILLFKDPNILLLTLLFVLPCFHPLIKVKQDLEVSKFANVEAICQQFALWMLLKTKVYAFMCEGLLFCPIFNKVCTHSSNGRLQKTSRKSSMSHNTFATSLFEFLGCIFIIKRWYSSYTYFVETT